MHYPYDHKDVTFSIGGYEYEFRDGKIVEAFGLDNVVVYLQEIRLGFTDLLRSPKVSSLAAIHDFAYTPLSGTPPPKGDTA